MASAPHGVILFGGTTGSPTQHPNDSWLWNGIVWTPLAPVGPAGRLSPVMTYDDHNDRAILFGGSLEQGVYLGDTWVFQPGADRTLFLQQPASRVVQSGEAVVLTALALGREPIFYQWRLNGVPLVDGGSVSGSQTPMLTINPVTPQHAGTYTLDATGLCGFARSDSAMLAVVSCYANCDSSTGTPALTAIDFACFIDRYAATDPYANCDGSTTAPVLNANDFACFLDRFAVGCP